MPTSHHGGGDLTRTVRQKEPTTAWLDAQFTVRSQSVQVKKPVGVLAVEQNEVGCYVAIADAGQVRHRVILMSRIQLPIARKDLDHVIKSPAGGDDLAILPASLAGEVLLES